MCRIPFFKNIDTQPNMEILIITLTIVPSLALLYYVYKKDPKREPWKLVLKTFAIGALSVIPAVLVEMFFDSITKEVLDENTYFYSFIDNFFQVALVEEFFKWLVVMFFIWNSSFFDDTYDGIVYCVCASLGFALFENIFYVMDGGLETAILRSLFTGHAIFGVVMGVYVSRARHNKHLSQTFQKHKNLMLSLAVPTILHGAYDFLCGSGDGTLVLIFLIFYVLIVVWAFKLIKREAANDHSLSE